jgi:hypothetical protein
MVVGVGREAPCAAPLWWVVVEAMPAATCRFVIEIEVVLLHGGVSWDEGCAPPSGVSDQ